MRLLGSIIRYELEAGGLALKADALNRPDVAPIPEGDTAPFSVAPDPAKDRPAVGEWRKGWRARKDSNPQPPDP